MYFQELKLHTQEMVFLCDNRSILLISLKKKKKTGMLGCKPCEVLIEQNHRLGDSPKPIVVDQGKYQHLVGK